MLRIGILDEEMEYVGRLAAYLNRMNKGSIQCSAFTQKDKLYEFVQQHHPEVIMSTNERLLMCMAEEYNKICYIWLTEGQQEKKQFHPINRYQSGVRIAKEVNRILYADALYLVQQHPLVAVYSPIGRCGKTQMILDYIQGQDEKRWMYIGMEDYGVVCDADRIDWLYLVKERKEDKLLEWIGQSNGIVESPFSPFDTKTMKLEDMEWFLQLLKKEKGYHGIFFDIGTGILQDIQCLTLFDQVIVPYIEEPVSLQKKEKFEQLVSAYGLAASLDKVHFLNMRDPAGLSGILEK